MNLKTCIALALVALSFVLVAPGALSFVARETSTEDKPDGVVASARTEGVAEIRLLGVNDFHGNLESPKELNGRPVGGAAHLASYLDVLESEGRREAIRVHAGDMVGASPLASSYFHDEPAVRAMNEMDFEVGVPGNHEFDEGMDEMTRLMDGGRRDDSETSEEDFPGADFPYLAANVVDRESGELPLPAYEVKEIDGVRVGFVGVVTLETPEITDPSVGDSLRFLDISETVNRYAGELRADGVNTVVVLAHSGGTQSGSVVSGEIVTETDQMSGDVDVVFGGHTHSRMNTRVAGQIVVEGGEYGEAVSVVDLDVDRESGEVVASSSRLVTTYADTMPPDREMLALTDRYVGAVAEMANREVGTSSGGISRASTPAGESALGNFIADARRDYSGADFAFVLSGALRDDLPAGEITYGDIFAANPGENGLVVTDLTGSQVREALEEQFREGRDRRFQVSGMTYSYDPSLPYGERVTSLTLPDGAPIAPDGTYTVATGEYIAQGGNGFDVFEEGENSRRVGREIDATVSYVEDLPEPFVPPDPFGQPRQRVG